MQLSFITQGIRNAGSHIASGASTAGHTAAQWGSRAVQILSSCLSALATYASSAASYAKTFFSTYARTAVAYCSSQPYVAAGVGGVTVAALAFLAVRHFRRAHP